MRGPLLVLPFVISSATAAVTVATVGVYDPADTNQVNRNASGNAIGSTAANDLVGFRTNVASAFSAGTGGVMDFESNAAGTSDTIFNATFGGGKTLGLTVNSSSINTFTSITPTSGTQGLLVNTGTTAAMTVNFGTLANGDLLNTAGFTLLSRDSKAQTVLVEWFVNGSASAVFSDTEAIAATKASDDVFFSYTAAEGSRISGFKITFDTLGVITTDDRLAIDDLGFITVPEPSAAVLFGAAALGFIGRRRRRN